VSVSACVSSQLYVSTSNRNKTSPPSGPGNPIGKLQELTQKKYLAPPEYEFEDDGRPPHEREYTCTVKLLQYTSTGKHLPTFSIFCCHVVYCSGLSINVLLIDWLNRSVFSIWII